MATKQKGQVTLNGRFAAGERVRLVRVEGEHVLRAEGGEVVASAVVGDDGSVTFKGLEVGGRYFACGRIGSRVVEVRLTGRLPEDDGGLLGQAPVGYEPVPAPRHVPDAEPTEGSRLAQNQVGEGVPQRSSTAFGEAHPVDPGERVPYASQEDPEFSSGTVAQASDTPFGRATPVEVVAAKKKAGK